MHCEEDQFRRSIHAREPPKISTDHALLFPESATHFGAMVTIDILERNVQGLMVLRWWQKISSAGECWRVTVRESHVRMYLSLF